MPVEFFCYIIDALILFFITKICKKCSPKFLNILCLLISLTVLIFTICVNNELLISIARSITIYFVGAVFYDFADKIKIDFKFFIISSVLLVVCSFFSLFNISILLFLPYIIIFFTMGLKQCNNKFKLPAMSYEVYLVAFPIQQAVTYL